jgi:protein TonB
MKKKLRREGLLLVVGVLMPFCALAEDPVAVPTNVALARVAKRVSPVYPPAAKQMRVAGAQDVEVTVSKAGEVEDAKIVKGNAMFTNSTIEAVKQWKFQPMVMKDGQTVRFSTVLTISYTL